MSLPHKPNKATNLVTLADEIRNEALEQQLKRIRDAIYTHAREVGGPFEVKNIKTSRFTPAQEAYEKGYISCGTIVNIAVEVLRNLDYTVKRVHGSIPQTPTHAWISVKDKKTNIWHQYDLTKKDFQISARYHQEFMVNDWNEIKEVIETIYNTNHQITDR